MRKGMRLGAVALAAVITIGAASTAMAGEWKKDSKGWWWQNDDGSYPTSSWQWLDGNKDGVAEYYYFDNTGYMLENTRTPDGNTVNADGAWILDGAVQTQTVAVAAAPVQQAASQIYTDDYSGTYVYDGTLYGGTTYHVAYVLSYNKSSNTIDCNYTWITGNGVNENLNEKYVYVGPAKDSGHIMFDLVSDIREDAISFAAPGQLDWFDNGSKITIQRQ